MAPQGPILKRLQGLTGASTGSDQKSLPKVWIACNTTHGRPPVADFQFRCRLGYKDKSKSGLWLKFSR